ncbi:MAG: hypothetical protein IJT88_01730, partial [Kiritimatiellae bacterium]|nr:hypothetical protein [Kiritimatiellia bacterium]
FGLLVMGCLPMYSGTAKRRTQDKFSAISKKSRQSTPPLGVNPKEIRLIWARQDVAPPNLAATHFRKLL